MVEKIKSFLGGKKSIYALVCLIIMILDDSKVIDISDKTLEQIDNIVYILIGSHMLTDITCIIKDKPKETK